MLAGRDPRKKIDVCKASTFKAGKRSLLPHCIGKVSPKYNPSSSVSKLDSIYWWGKLSSSISKGVGTGMSGASQLFLWAIYRSPIFFLPLSNLSCPSDDVLSWRQRLLSIKWTPPPPSYCSLKGEFIPDAVLIAFQYISLSLQLFSCNCYSWLSSHSHVLSRCPIKTFFSPKIFCGVTPVLWF